MVADEQGDSEAAVEHARSAISAIEPDPHLLHFIDVLWGAGRVLLRNEAPESGPLSQQIGQGLGYLSFNLAEPEIRAKWFAMPAHAELAQLVGFSLPTGEEVPEVEAALTPQELDVLRGITSGDMSIGERTDDVQALLDKLGAESELQAIEYAIHAGITWQ